MTLSSFAALEAALRERTNYELRSPPPGGWGLERMTRLLGALGDPQLAYPVIHVAGTTGKGTTCAALASALDQAGLRVGLTTSPHLVDLRERIRIGALPAPDSLWLTAADAVLSAGDPADPPTYFELVVAMAFVAFREARVDVAVVEVGLGGRLDATNCVQPTVCVITRIGLDHGELLGTDLASVAAEKAGIIKPNVPVIAGAGSRTADRVIAERARALAAPLRRAETWDCPDRNADGRLEVAAGGLREAGPPATESPAPSGHHGAATRPGAAATSQADQRSRTALVVTPTAAYEVPYRVPRPVADNLVLAALALETFGEAVGRPLGGSISPGFARQRWRGRFDVLAATSDRPLIVVDGAHDPESVTALLEGVSQLSPVRPVVLFATLREKRPAALCALLAEACQEGLTCRAPSPRAASSAFLAETLRAQGLTTQESPGDLEHALDLAIERAHELEAPLVVTGSLYLAGAVLALLGEDVRAAWTADDT